MDISSNTGVLHNSGSYSADFINKMTSDAVNAAYRIYTELGPGLLESVYEVVLAKMLTDAGHHVQRQKPIPIDIANHIFSEGFRADIVINDCLIIELKSIEVLAPVHLKQVLTYIRLMDIPIGLLINFGAGRVQEGIRRIINNRWEVFQSDFRRKTSTEVSPTNQIRHLH
jgi:iron complex transport system substrate-binding protein